MNWIALTALLCLFGFVKEMRPSEAFLSMYLTGPWKNLTVEQIDNEVYPWWTYSYLIWLVPVFLLTDFLRYKPILVVDGLAYIATWAILVWAQGVPAMKGMQVTYGFVTAADVAYFSYLYCQVSKEYFKRISSFTRAAILTGKFTSYVIAQIMYSFDLMDLYQLHIFSFVSVCIAFVITFFLPWPKHSEIFHKKYQTEERSAETPDNDNKIPSEEFDAKMNGSNMSDNVTSHTKARGDENVSSESSSGFVFIWMELKSIYSTRIVIIWSIWWALASCGNFQVMNYVQNLWTVILSYKDSDYVDDAYNGAVEAAATLIGAIVVMVIGFIPVTWSNKAEIIMALVCGGNAAVLFIMAHTTSIWLAYVTYVFFRVSYVAVITIATAQIAQNLGKQRYGLVFGCNTFIALGIETILTVIVVDKSGLGVDVVVQFSVYGGYFGVIALLFFVSSLYQCFKPTYSMDLDTPTEAS